VAAVVVAVVAVNLAGSKVTARPIATVSSKGVEEALAGDATTVTASDVFGEGTESGAGVEDGATGPGSEVEDGPGAGGSKAAGSSGGAASVGASDDGGSVSGSDSGGSTSGGSGPSGPGPGSSTTTTEREDHPVTPTTVAPSGQVSKTFSGNRVTVQCTGNTITLTSTVAVAPYSKQIKSSGPSKVEVVFLNPTGDDVEVQATCSAGAVHWDD
jgi:hypothetical protein